MAITAFIIHKPVDAVKRGLVVGMILAIPWGGWLIRNAHVGLENVFAPEYLVYMQKRLECSVGLRFGAPTI